MKDRFEEFQTRHKEAQIRKNLNNYMDMEEPQIWKYLKNGKDMEKPQIWKYLKNDMGMEEPQIELMIDFFQKVKDILKSIRTIQENVQEIKKIQDKILSTPLVDEGVKEQLEKLKAEIQHNSNITKVNLKDIENSIKDHKSKKMENTIIRIQICQLSALSKEFAKALMEYNNLQIDYRDRCKKILNRQLHIVGRTVEDEELEKMIESGITNVFIQEIIIETQQTKQSLREIEDRNNDIKKLENSIKELHEMFTDMGLLVQNQGDVIDRIEPNVEQAAKSVEKAKSDTSKAFEYKSKAQKKKLLIAILVATLLITIVLIIYYIVK